MTTHDNTPTAPIPPDTVGACLEEVHRLATGVEPVTRDLNRTLTDLLGPCPVGESGLWTRVVTDDEGRACVQLPTLPLEEALRLSTAIAAVASGISPPSRKTSRFNYHLPFVLISSGDASTSGFAKAAL